MSDTGAEETHARVESNCHVSVIPRTTFLIKKTPNQTYNSYLPKLYVTSASPA